MTQTTETKTETPITLKPGELGSWWIYGPAAQVFKGAMVAARRPDGRTAPVTVDFVCTVFNGLAYATTRLLDEKVINYLDSHKTRITELDRRILRYIAENPGCSEYDAGVMGDSMSERGAAYRNWRLTLNIHRGLIRDEGRAGRASLYLTDAGKALISEDA